MTSISLRPVTPADEELLRATYASTRAEELAVTPWTDEQKDAFLRMQFDAQTAHYAATYDPFDRYVVVVDGEDAGRLLLAREDDLIRVVDVALLPPFRGRGVGERLLGDVLDEARAGGKRVVIHVEHQNRARSLYERLGFVEVENLGIYQRMEWAPPDQA